MSDGSNRDQRLERLVAEARNDVRAWTESGDEDVGIALVDLLSLVGDLLSSYQDVIADEANLGSTRSRVSVQVAGERWHRRPTLADSGPDDHHYVLVTDKAGRVVVQFGDGEHGKRPPTGSEISVRYRSGLGAAANRFVGVRLQEGRVVIDADWNEPAGHIYGVYRATVTDNVDPLLVRRLRVLIPDITGSESVWAMACLPPAIPDELPSVGDGVWVAFESGDPERPVWLGRLFTSA